MEGLMLRYLVQVDHAMADKLIKYKYFSWYTVEMKMSLIENHSTRNIHDSM